jgi:hypothetical protein
MLLVTPRLFQPLGHGLGVQVELLVAFDPVHRQRM